MERESSQVAVLEVKEAAKILSNALSEFGVSSTELSRNLEHNTKLINSISRKPIKGLLTPKEYGQKLLRRKS